MYSSCRNLNFLKAHDVDVLQIPEHDGISVLVDTTVLPAVAGHQQDLQVHSTAVSHITVD